jgi:hypothetical protein
LGGDGRWRRDGDGLAAAAAWESPRTGVGMRRVGSGVRVTSVCRGVGKRGGVATVAAAVGGGGGRRRRGGSSSGRQRWAARARWEASWFSSRGEGR